MLVIMNNFIVQPRSDANKLDQCLHIQGIQRYPHHHHDDGKHKQMSSNKLVPVTEQFSQPQPQFYLQPPSPNYFGPHHSPSNQSGPPHLSPNTIINHPSPGHMMSSPGHMMSSPGHMTYHSPQMSSDLSPYIHNQLSPHTYLSNPNSPAMSHIAITTSPKPLTKAPSNPNLHYHHHQGAGAYHQGAGLAYAHQPSMETLYPVNHPPSYEETFPSQYPLQQDMLYVPHSIDYSHHNSSNLYM